MIYTPTLTAEDARLAGEHLLDFVPSEVFDIHAHLVRPQSFPLESGFLEDGKILGAGEHRRDLSRYMPAAEIHGLYFGFPHRKVDRQTENAWISDECIRSATPRSRALLLVAPEDPPDQVAMLLRSKPYRGVKVYHSFLSRTPTTDAHVPEYAPEWIWDILNEVHGVLMMHLVRDEAIADPKNQEAIRRLCDRYPRVRLILAHVARSFNYRHARKGLSVLSDLENAFVDTSALGEAAAMAVALRTLGPRRVLWGSDYPVSEARGRCVTTGSQFHWLHAGPGGGQAKGLTLVGLESLICLREACEDNGLSREDISDIFLGNALRILSP